MAMRRAFYIFMVLCAFSSFAMADIINGSFETGTLAGWTAQGDVTVLSSSNWPSFLPNPPPNGIYQAVISNAAGGYDPRLPPGFTFSGTRAVLFGGADFSDPLLTHADWVTFATTHMAGFQGGGLPYANSVLGQSFTANAGSTLQFDLSSFGSPFFGDPGWDYALIDFDGSLTILNAAGAFGAFPSFAQGIPIPTSGTHYFGVMIVNGGDTDFDSAILLDDVYVDPVPEPSTWLLFGSGLVGLVTLRKFKKMPTFES